MSYCFKTKQDAELAARKLCDRLKGTGWKPRVWNNMGWHAEARNYCIRIHMTPYENKYSIFMSDYEGSCGGSGSWLIRGEDSDPNRLVEVQMNAAMKYANALSKLVDTQAKAVGVRKPEVEETLDDMLVEVKRFAKALAENKKKRKTS